MKKKLADIDLICIVGLACVGVLLSGIWWVPVLRKAWGLP